MRVPHPSVSIRLPGLSSMLVPLGSRFQMLYDDHDSIRVEGGLADLIINKHGNYRILSPSGMSHKIIIA